MCTFKFKFGTVFGKLFIKKKGKSLDKSHLLNSIKVFQDLEMLYFCVPLSTCELY